MDEYVHKFNTLPGNQKNFNIYMQEVKHAGIDINLLLEILQPQHALQQVFYTRLAIEFGHRQKIMCALTSGNKQIIKTVLRKADLQALFEDVTSKQFIEEVCIKLSPTTRVKLINRLGKSDYFQCMASSYGINDCKGLLVDCNMEILKPYIINAYVQFTDRELIKIYQKHGGDCLELYFKHRKNASFSNSNKLGKYLILHNVEDYVKLLKFGYPKLGRKCLKKLITSKLVDVKDLYTKLEKEKLEHKKLDVFARWKNLNIKYNTLYYLIPINEYIDVFANTLPDNVDKFLDNSSAIIDFLKKIRKAERGKILFKTFKVKYGFEIYSSLNYIRKEIMELLPLEERYMFDLNDGYEEMMGVDKSIPLLKEKINATTISSQRVTLLNKLVDTCKINDDLIALKDVLKYFNKRHRNEERFLRDAFLYQVLYNFKHERFDVETWKLISEAIDVFTINNEFCDGIFLFLETEIYNKYNKGEDYTNDLKRFIKDTGCYVSWNLMHKHPAIEKSCIIKSHEFINDLFKKDEQLYAYLEFFNTIADWNKRHNKQEISFLEFSTVLKIILDIQWDSWHYQGSILQKALQFIPRNKSESEIHQMILEKIFELYCKNITESSSLWLLNHRPDYLLGKAKIFLHEDVYKLKFLQKIAMNYSLKLHEEFIDVALNIITNPDEHEQELNGAFTYLLLIPKYFKVLEQFLLSTENPLRLRNLITKLKSNSFPENNLNIITYLIKTKYYSVVTSCLDHTLYHSREETLIGFVNTCKNNQVFALVTSLINSKIGLQIISNDDNCTKFILKCLYRISTKDPNAWEIFLKKLDTEKITFIPKLTRLPEDRIALLLDRIFKFELDLVTTFGIVKQLRPERIDSKLLDMILKIYSKHDNEKNFIYKIFLHNPKLLEHLRSEFNELMPEITKTLCSKSLTETEFKPLAITMIELLNTLTDDNFTKLTAHYLQYGFENFEHILITQLQKSSRMKFIYTNTVKSFLTSLQETSEDELWILSEKLVNVTRDESVLCLAVEILPQKLPKNEVLLHKCCSLIETIEMNNFPIVNVFLNKYMRVLT